MKLHVAELEGKELHLAHTVQEAIEYVVTNRIRKTATHLDKVVDISENASASLKKEDHLESYGLWMNSL